MTCKQAWKRHFIARPNRDAVLGIRIVVAAIYKLSNVAYSPEATSVQDIAEILWRAKNGYVQDWYKNLSYHERARFPHRPMWLTENTKQK